MDSNDAKLFQKERLNTDLSLDAERKKTNLSLNEAQTKSEQRTDEVVRQTRDELDEATLSARTATNASSNFVAGRELQSERSHTDRSVETERSQVDAAIEQGRETMSSMVASLLDQERQETDENLSVERSATDSQVGQASDQLSNEIAEHSKTKISLTSREEFLAIVSHDLRNPIGAASSCAEMLLEDSAYRDLDAEKIKYWIEFIKRNVDTSLRLISDLLDMERIAMGRLQLKLANHGIEPIIKESIENFAYAASAKTVLLRTSTSKISGEVFGDRDRILQVLSNLIGNAIKFTPEGGSVILGAETTQDGVQFCVRDSGPGIPEQKQTTLFDRFTQLGTNDRRGLGLGLYISKMLTEAHGGKIWVESAEGQGSAFFLSLPTVAVDVGSQMH